MKPAKEKYYRGLFTIAAFYDLVLGITFTFCPARAFDALGIGDKLPVFGGYITLLGAFVLVIGIAYALISRGDSSARCTNWPTRQQRFITGRQGASRMWRLAHCLAWPTQSFSS